MGKVLQFPLPEGTRLALKEIAGDLEQARRRLASAIAGLIKRGYLDLRSPNAEALGEQLLEANRELARVWADSSSSAFSRLDPKPMALRRQAGSGATRCRASIASRLPGAPSGSQRQCGSLRPHPPGKD